MLFRTLSAAVYGIDADLVDIEVNLTPVRGESDQSPPVTIVGLPDAAVRESRERIRAAIQNCGHFFPFQKTTINLAPADVRKEGASFDLPIALGILGANGELAESHNLIHVLCVGELSLDGRVGNLKTFSRFFDSKSGEETEFDYLALLGVHLSQNLEGVIQCYQLARSNLRKVTRLRQ